MKKYLFGLGTMLVGAGLMFVLMHGEVSAGSMTKGKYKNADCQVFELSDEFGALWSVTDNIVNYCKMKDLTCVIYRKGLSCVKS